MLKPNLSRLMEHTSGANTHPLVLAAAETAIGERPITGVKVRRVYELNGITELADKHGAALLEFDGEPSRSLSIPDGRLMGEVKVARAWWEYDFVASIAVMKTHMHTGATLSVKNMKGILWRKQKVAFHQLQAPEGLVPQGAKELDLAIAEMSTVLYPLMAILDGFIGMEGMGPGRARPRARAWLWRPVRRWPLIGWAPGSWAQRRRALIT